MGTPVFLAGSGYPSVPWPKWPRPLPEPSLQGPWLLLRGALSQRAIGQLPCCGWHPQLNRLPSQLQAWFCPWGPGWGAPAPAFLLRGRLVLRSISPGTGEAMEDQGRQGSGSRQHLGLGLALLF